MPTQPRPGMDHDHYQWSPVVQRPALRWPDDARVALCVILVLDHMEWSPPPEAYSATLPGGSGARPFPDYARMSHREYGHRVGIFALLDLLEGHGIVPTVAMDALTTENYPLLVRHCQARGCEIIGHGISASRMITSKMSEDEESAYIQASLDSIVSATGTAPAGWMGPEHGESTRTPGLLARAGVRYVCDWANDEQPYTMSTPDGNLTALPIMMELDDVIALFDRKVRIDRYRTMLTDAFDALYRDGAGSGRLLVLSLRPWLSGQPFRLSFLDDALGRMMGRQGVWAATGRQIDDWYRRLRL